MTTYAKYEVFIISYRNITASLLKERRWIIYNGYKSHIYRVFISWNICRNRIVSICSNRNVNKFQFILIIKQ